MSSAFAATVREEQVLLRKGRVTVVQINLGNRCNQRCAHCHVGGGPEASRVMAADTLARVLDHTVAGGIAAVELTGGAPELHPGFRGAVRRLRAAGKAVTVRSNLTVFCEPGLADLPGFLAAQGVALSASLPCYSRDNVDAQRGAGAFEKSIAVMRQLNAAGFGLPGGPTLDLVYNPGGPFLPAPQHELEGEYRAALRDEFGLAFSRLVTIANMPIARFRRRLEQEQELAGYQRLLAASFNPATLDRLMCRYLLSVGWDGRVYDCDFNQALGLAIPGCAQTRFWELADAEFPDTTVAVDDHCFACTAGAGSGCHGAVV